MREREKKKYDVLHKNNPFNLNKFEKKKKKKNLF